MSSDPALALDLVNSAPGGRYFPAPDVLGTPGGLATWLAEREQLLGPVGEGAALRSAEFRELRDTTRELFGALVAREPVPVRAVERVNEASARVPRTLRLAVTGDGLAVEELLAASDVTRALGELARSAIALIGGPDRGRLRICSARRCGRFFLASRARQAWCSNACGNRERVARHHARSRGP